MSDRAPEGWIATRFDTVIHSSFYGPRFSSGDYTETGTPTIRTTDMSARGRIELSDAPKVTLDSEQLKKFGLADGDLLVTRTGTIGRCALYTSDLGPAIPSAYLIRFRLRKAIVDPRFALVFLQSPSGQEQLGLGATAVTQPNINAKSISAFQFLLPPFVEQSRIVEKVESLLAQVDRTKERLDRVSLILTRFRQAVLAVTCCDGEELELRDLLESVRYGTAVKCSPTAKGTPVLRIPNVVAGVIDHADMKYGPLSAKEKAALNLVPGDLLMIRSNGSVNLVGKAALVTERDVGCSYAGYLMRLRPKLDRAVPEYLRLALQTYDVRVQIEVPARSTSGVHNINSDEVRNLRVCVPSLEQQRERIKEAHRLLSLADTIERRVQAASARCKKLPQAILAKAFAGELVSTEAELAKADGRTYETAEDALKRVRQEVVTGRRKPSQRSGALQSARSRVR